MISCPMGANPRVNLSTKQLVKKDSFYVGNIMLFCFLLLAAVSLPRIHADNDYENYDYFLQRYKCPSILQIKPCMCSDTLFGLKIFCNGSHVDQIMQTLSNIVYSDFSLNSVTILDVWLPNLPSNLFVERNIVEIQIRKCNISSVDENAFDRRLGSLDLNDNVLEHVPSKALEKLSSLHHLYLERNKIENLHAGAFNGLEYLYHLSLKGNRIKFIDNSAFEGIGIRFPLMWLELGDNELTAVPGLPLRNHTSLFILELNNNKIALVPEDLDPMSNVSLDELNLDMNKIRYLPASVFRSVKSLNNLTLTGNDIESLHPSAFEGIEDKLKFLGLGFNQLEEVPAEALRNMSVLRFLDLSGNKICQIKKDDFLTYGGSLIYIDLNHNSLMYLDPEAFTGLPSLQFLNLGSNQLKTVFHETVAPVLDTLKFLDMRDNPFHCNCNLSWFQDLMKRPIQRIDVWLEVWMRQEGWMRIPKHSIDYRREVVKCVTPEEYANASLASVPSQQLACGNSTLNPLADVCCNCNTNTDSDVFMSIFTYLFPTIG